MRRDTHRRALAATARVACAAALIACNPKTAPEGGAEPTAAVDVPDVAVEPETIDVSAEERSPDQPFAWADFPDDVQACRNQVTVECCTKVGEHLDSIGTQGEAIWDNRGDCCNKLEWRGPLACTPWGPPTPPAMA